MPKIQMRVFIVCAFIGLSSIVLAVTRPVAVQSPTPRIHPQTTTRVATARLQQIDDQRSRALAIYGLQKTIHSLRPLVQQATSPNCKEIQRWAREHPLVIAVAWKQDADRSPFVCTTTKRRQDENAFRYWQRAVYALSSISRGPHWQENPIGLYQERNGTMTIHLWIDVSYLGRLHSWQSTHLLATPFTLKTSRHYRGIQAQSIGHEIAHALPGEIIATFIQPPTAVQRQQMATALDAVVKKVHGTRILFYSERLRHDEMLRRIRTFHPVYAEPHYAYTAHKTTQSAFVIPNDALYAQYQWNIQHIRAPVGWKASTGTDEVIVAVIDTGVQLDHPDLQGRLIAGYNAVDPLRPPWDDVGHGTHVAGIIAATTNNRSGIAGITWRTRIMPIKVLDQDGAGDAWTVATGIRWAIEHGADVINFSLGNYAGAHFLHEAIIDAYHHGVALIAATGNDESDQPGYPAAYPEVLAVTASDESDQKASFANYGAYVDVIAPGEHITSTYPTHMYATLSGTSMASPHVAALAALLKATDPTLSPQQIYDRITATAQDILPKGNDPLTGAGLIDIAHALQSPRRPAPQEKTTISKKIKKPQPWWLRWWNTVQTHWNTKK